MTMGTARATPRSPRGTPSAQEPERHPIKKRLRTPPSGTFNVPFGLCSLCGGKDNFAAGRFRLSSDRRNVQIGSPPDCDGLTGSGLACCMYEMIRICFGGALTLIVLSKVLMNNWRIK